MHERSPDRALRSLQSLPGVGPALAGDLARLGYREPDDLVGLDANLVFQQLREASATQVDVHVLDAIRAAVHAATALEPDERSRRWWSWSKDRCAAPMLAE